MTLLLILLALAILLTGIATYELHVSREISALADRLTAALDACGDTTVTIQWRTRQAPWDMHRADLTLDCIGDLLADRPDLRDAILHDEAWISFTPHDPTRERNRP